MADNVTMDQFILEVRRLGGFETTDQANSFVTDDEISSRGNANMRKVYLALVRARGANYYRKTVEFQTVVGQRDYAFSAIGASDFFELISMSRLYGTTWLPLVDFNERERDEYDEWPFSISGSPVRFALRPTGIEVQPAPAAADTVRMNYVPSYVKLLTALQADGPATIFDGVAGFHEWAIWETVAELQVKDMADPSLALSKASWWEAEVESMARQRHAGGPRRVSRVRAQRRHGYRNRGDC